MSNFRKKYLVFTVAACVILSIIKFLVVVGLLEPYSSVPREIFKLRLFEFAGELNLQCQYVESRPFIMSELPVAQRVLFRLGTQKKRVSVDPLGLDDATKLLEEWSFTNTSGHFIVSTFAISNRVILVKCSGEGKIDDFALWTSKLREAFPQVKILKK